MLPTYLPEADTAEALRLLNGRGMPSWAREIVIRISKAHAMSPLDIVMVCRARDVVAVRYEIFYVLKTTASPVSGQEPSYPQIGKWFLREHTGILWGVATHARNNGLPPVGNYDLDAATSRKRKRADRRLRNG